MKVRYTVHRRASMVGQVEDVSEDYGARLIAAGHAVAVADTVAAAPARAVKSARPAKSDGDSAG